MRNFENRVKKLEGVKEEDLYVPSPELQKLVADLIELSQNPKPTWEELHPRPPNETFEQACERIRKLKQAEQEADS